MIKLPNTFYETSKGLQNSAEVRKLVLELKNVLQDLQSSIGSILDVNDILRQQGKIQLLQGILEGFENADQMVSRIRKRTDATGPLNVATT